MVHSEHYNPLTNMKYNQQGKTDNNTLEVLAVPTFA